MNNLFNYIVFDKNKTLRTLMKKEFSQWIKWFEAQIEHP